MKIYIDILIITNAIVVIVYLRCIGRILHQKTEPAREAIACITGGIGSLIVLIPTDSFAASALVTLAKLAVISAVSAIAFAPFDFYGCIKRIFLYGLCELLMGGACFLLVETTHSKVIYSRNYVMYFDISLLQLTLCCSAVYLLIIIWENIQRRRESTLKRYTITYICGRYRISLPAIADTGNKLCDSFTGTPVVIFRSDEMYEHFNLDSTESAVFYGFRPIPYETISGSSVIYITSKGTVKINGNGESKTVDCCIGIIPQQQTGYAIFDPLLLI